MMNQNNEQLSPEDLIELFKMMDEGQTPTPDQLFEAVVREVSNPKKAHDALLKSVAFLEALIVHFQKRIDEE